MKVMGLGAVALAARFTLGPVTVLLVGDETWTTAAVVGGIVPALPLKNSRMSGAVFAAEGKFAVVPMASRTVRRTL
jgi:hypothetical protein